LVTQYFPVSLSLDFHGSKFVLDVRAPPTSNLLTQEGRP